MRPKAILSVVLLIHTGCGLSFRHKTDALDYEIYELRGSKDRELLSKGTVTSDGHNVESIDTSSSSALGMPVWDKSVPLSQGYVVGASVYREKELKGFGLWICKPGDGFSWNWFVKEDGRTFRKLQGAGHVKVSLVPSKDCEELAAIEFLDDVTLTGSLGAFPLFLDHTHQIVIKKGSTLCLVP